MTIKEGGMFIGDAKVRRTFSSQLTLTSLCGGGLGSNVVALTQARRLSRWCRRGQRYMETSAPIARRHGCRFHRSVALPSAHVV